VVSVFATFEPPDEARGGFRIVAGTPTGLSRLLLAVGRLPAEDRSPIMHLHHGEEVLHVVSGRLLVRIGRQRRECGPGDVLAVPAGEWHGFQVLDETVLEVLAEQRIGTVYQVRTPDGGVELVETYRKDTPWGRPPPEGVDWTSDAEVRRIFDNLDPTV